MSYAKSEREQFKQMAPVMTVAQIGVVLNMKIRNVYRRLDKFGLRAIAVHPPRVKKAESKRPTVDTVIASLEVYFQMSLHLDTVSLFARDRLRKGVCLSVIKKVSGLSAKKISSLFSISEPEQKNLITYAKSKSADQINLLTSQIKTTHDNGKQI